MTKPKQPILEQTFEITSILGGFSENQYSETSKNTYYSSVGVDPDFAIMNYNKTSGAIIPISYQKFSSSNVTSPVMWLMTNPKNTNLYAYLTNGRFISYDLNLANETLIGTTTSGAGNGGAYYNNYIYFC